MIMSVVCGHGSYLPENIVSNEELSKTVDTNDEWIAARTGIRQRHIAKDGETTSVMAAEAARNALKNSGLQPEDIDLLIVATTTPDRTFPSVAVTVQAALGFNNAAAFDVQAVCSGFVYAVSIANNFIKAGQAKNVMVIGAEKMSSILDWQDRTTCILFGDGAGAIILKAEKDGNRGVIATQIHSDGRLQDILLTDGGVSSSATAGKIKMAGKEVFKHAVAKMSKGVMDILEQNNLSVSDIDLLIPHQANSRILDAIAEKLALPEEKVISTVAMHANTSAASIPLAIDEACKARKISESDIVVLTALGGGLTWGTCLLRW